MQPFPEEEAIVPRMRASKEVSVYPEEEMAFQGAVHVCAYVFVCAKVLLSAHSNMSV